MSAADQKIRDLQDNIEHVIKGKPEAVRLTITTLLARGHLLIEDVPGIGKTTLAHSLARSLDCDFRRIQFTSDLLPSDILGVTIYNQQTQAFEFKAGPIFANIILADEINRTTPKTQSSLLEAMNDVQVSVDSHTYPLPKPFMVIATQNPLEYHGTYPLPESQLDRFMMRIRIGYPDLSDEKVILTTQHLFQPAGDLKPVLTAAEVLDLQNAVDRVRMDEVARHLGDMHFAWMGGFDEASVFYYRLHSPVILIEFDHQRGIVFDNDAPSRRHIHTVVRTPNGNDYGKDLLRQHHEQWAHSPGAPQHSHVSGER